MSSRDQPYIRGLGPLYGPWQIRIPLRTNVPITNPSRLLEFHQMPPSEPFRLLDLPREIRDTVYRAMLCDWGFFTAFGHTLVNGNVVFDPMRRDIEPNILLANKQIYQEAKLVLLKGNQFVHIRMDVRNGNIMPAIFIRNNVPVVAVSRVTANRVAARRRLARRDCGDVFKDLVVMTYCVDFALQPRTHTEEVVRIDVILLHRHLQQFCRAVALLDVSGPYSSHTKHKVTIHNPFVKTLSPDFLNYKNQERLLEPYSSKFRGINHFEIDGHVQPDLAQVVVAKVLQELIAPDPETFPGDLLRRKELGKKAFDDGDSEKAEKIWRDAYHNVLMLLNSKIWSCLKDAGGKGFARQVTELVFEIQSNRAESYLVAMRKIPLQIQISESRSIVGHVEEAGKVRRLRAGLVVLMRNLHNICFVAERIGHILGTDWTQSNEQQAKLHYRMAQGLRLVGRDCEGAVQSIYRAIELLPDDEEIQSEAQQIKVWKARVVGGWRT